MPVSSMKDLLEAGVHFGHHTRKWDPKMRHYIYGQRNDIHIIDLHKTRKKLEEVYETVRQMAFNGATFLFVGTKKQAQDSIQEAAQACGQYYVNQRWLGGMLTNWQTIQTRIDRLNQLDKMAEDGTLEKLPKKEQAQRNEEREKLQQVLGGIREMVELPDCLFIVDCKKEHIAIKEAHRLEIPIVAVVDTNCDPELVQYAIPGNDDAIRAVKLMADQMAEAINEGRLMAQSAREQVAEAALHGAAGGAVHIGEGGRIEYVGAPVVEMPPVATGEDEEEGDMGQTLAAAESTEAAPEAAPEAVTGTEAAASVAAAPVADKIAVEGGDTLQAPQDPVHVPAAEVEAAAEIAPAEVPQSNREVSAETGALTEVQDEAETAASN